jgi:hypothetical protein
VHDLGCRVGHGVWRRAGANLRALAWRDVGYGGRGDVRDRSRGAFGWVLSGDARHRLRGVLTVDRVNRADRVVRVVRVADGTGRRHRRAIGRRRRTDGRFRNNDPIRAVVALAFVLGPR